MNEVILKVNNKNYKNWEAINVGKSLFQLAGSFGFVATNIIGYKPESWDIRLGDPCTVEVDGQTLITGYVEEMPISYDKEMHTIQVAGRDKTGDLVDCSYIETPNLWENQSIENIIKTVCKPFDIPVVIDDSVVNVVTTEIPKVKSYEGEMILELISRLCMVKAILPVCYGDGKLTLTRAGTNRTDDNLQLGMNIKSGIYEQSDMERFSKYIVKGQGAVTDDFFYTPNVGSRHGEFIDNVLTDKGRYRPMVILPDRPLTDKECEERAEWEARVRMGQSRKIDYVVQGWKQTKTNKVWPLNSLVVVKDKFFGIDGTRLISALEFSLDNTGGMTTKITIVPKKAFELLEKPIEEDDTQKFFTSYGL